MKLQQFRITQYRNIRDSGLIELEDDLACIVGKNQSGKTALLRGLQGLNPAEQHNLYDIERDWPRTDRAGKDPNQVVCTARFGLDDRERRDLERLGLTSRSPVVEITRDYAGAVEISFPSDAKVFGQLHPNPVDKHVSILACPHPNAGQPFRSTAQRAIHEIRRLAQEGRFAALVEACGAQEGLFRDAMPATISQRQRANDFCESHQAALNDLIAAVEELPTLQRQIHEYVISNAPRFIYMDEYREFSGSAVLTDMQERVEKNAVQLSDTTFQMLLSLAKLDLKKLIEQGYS